MTARELIKILLELPLEEKIEFYLMGRYKGKKYKCGHSVGGTKKVSVKPFINYKSSWQK